MMNHSNPRRGKAQQIFHLPSRKCRNRDDQIRRRRRLPRLSGKPVAEFLRAVIAGHNEQIVKSRNLPAKRFIREALVQPLKQIRCPASPCVGQETAFHIPWKPRALRFPVALRSVEPLPRVRKTGCRQPFQDLARIHGYPGRLVAQAIGRIQCNPQTTSLTVPGDLIFLQLPVKRRAPYAEQLRGRGTVSPRLPKRVLDCVALQFLQRDYTRRGGNAIMRGHGAGSSSGSRTFVTTFVGKSVKWSNGPSLNAIMRSRQFLTSRIFPGQSYRSIASRASFVRTYLVSALASMRSINSGISALRSRSGGRVIRITFSLWNRSSRKRPAAISRSRSRWVAATTRISTRIRCSDPTGRYSCSCRTRRSFTCSSIGR